MFFFDYFLWWANGPYSPDLGPCCYPPEVGNRYSCLKLNPHKRCRSILIRLRFSQLSVASFLCVAMATAFSSLFRNISSRSLHLASATAAAMMAKSKQSTCSPATAHTSTGNTHAANLVHKTENLDVLLRQTCSNYVTFSAQP